MGISRRRTARAVLLATSGVVSAVSPLPAADINWTNTSGISVLWGTASNWSPASVPGASDIAIFSAPSNKVIDLGGVTRSVAAVRIIPTSGNYGLSNGGLSLTIFEANGQFGTSVPLTAAGSVLQIIGGGPPLGLFGSITAPTLDVNGSVDFFGSVTTSTLNVTRWVNLHAASNSIGSATVNSNSTLTLNSAGRNFDSLLMGASSLLTCNAAVSVGTISIGGSSASLIGTGSLTADQLTLTGSATSLSNSIATTILALAGPATTLTKNGSVELRLGDGVSNGAFNLQKLIVGSSANVVYQSGALNLNALQLNAGCSFKLAGPDHQTLRLTSITWNGSGPKLDLVRSRLALAAGNGAGVYPLLIAGYHGGLWNGPGIMTSDARAADPDEYTTLGFATASQALGIGDTETAVWGGKTVMGTDELVRYTYGGDANLDGKIDVDDYGQIDFNINIPFAARWYNGDFNYDQTIDVDDYGIIDFNWGIQGPPFAPGAAASIAAVPEPSILSALSVVAMLSRRRRR